MRRRSGLGRRDAGASTLEYAAVIAMAAILVVAVVGIARQAPVPQFITDAICKVSAAVGIGPCADGPGSGDQDGEGEPDVDIPEGLDPESDLVQMLVSTERGRQTLQWLADNEIPIVIDPDATGAYWDETQIVLGENFDNAAVVVHEANHAQYDAEGRSPVAAQMDRDAYVAASVDEEVDGTVQQIIAAWEFREAGYEIGEQPAEAAYDAAYAEAIQNGQTVGEAERAGRDAVSDEILQWRHRHLHQRAVLSGLLRRLLGQRELMGEMWNLPASVDRGIRVTGNRRSLTRRVVLLGGALLVAVLLSACGPSSPETSSTPSASGASVSSAPPGDLRVQLAAALRDSSPANASLVEDQRTNLTKVPADWLPGWQIIDVQNSAPPHPRRFYAALSTDGHAEVLTGKPDAFSTVLVDAGVQVDSAELAADIGTVFLDSTRDFRAYAYRIDSVADIEWLPKPTAAQQATRDQVMKTYESKIKPPQATQSSDGWQVTVWMVQGRDLVTHQLGIASGTAVSDQAETAEKDIPVPYSA